MDLLLLVSFDFWKYLLKFVTSYNSIERYFSEQISIVKVPSIT